MVDSLHMLPSDVILCLTIYRVPVYQREFVLCIYICTLVEEGDTIALRIITTLEQGFDPTAHYRHNAISVLYLPSHPSRC